MKNKKYILLIIILLLFQQGFSQEETEKKLHFYGGIGLSLSGNYFLLSLQPGLLYDVSNTFKAGAGVQYTYGKSSSGYIGEGYSFNVYGFNVMTLAYPIAQIELSGEYENLYVSYYYSDMTKKYWSPALFAGIGYREKNFSVGLRYNFLYQEGTSIYNDALIPYVRIYF